MKDRLWKDKANDLNIDSECLQVWYKSMRTRYGKLNKSQSGQGVKKHTERDSWILKSFSFIASHIHTCPKRTSGLVSIHFIRAINHTNCTQHSKNPSKVPYVSIR